MKQQLAKYLFVGIIANLLAYAIFCILTLVGINALLSMTLVYVASCTTSFYLNRLWTFSSHGSIRNEIVKYFAVQAMGYASNLFILYFLHYKLSVNQFFAQLISICIVAVELFLLNRYYVFSKVK